LINVSCGKLKLYGILSARDVSISERVLFTKTKQQHILQLGHPNPSTLVFEKQNVICLAIMKGLSASLLVCFDIMHFTVA
jgi:hypothetical protein